MGKNTSKFDEKFVKDCGDNSDKRYIFAVEAEYSKQLRDSRYVFGKTMDNVP